MVGTIVDRLEMRLADVVALRGPRRRPGQRPLLDVGAAAPRPRSDGGDAGDRRRLRAVRHRPGAGPARVEQQPRQHAPFRARPIPTEWVLAGRACARRARRVRPRARASLGGRMARCSTTVCSSLIVRAKRDERPRKRDPTTEEAAPPTMTARQCHSAHGDHRARSPEGLPRRAPRAVRGDRRARATRTSGRRSPASYDVFTAARPSPRRGRRRCGSATVIVPVYTCGAAAARPVRSPRVVAPPRPAGSPSVSARRRTSSSRTGTASRSRSPTSAAATRSGSCAPGARGREGHSRLRDVLGQGLPPRRHGRRRCRRSSSPLWARHAAPRRPRG